MRRSKPANQAGFGLTTFWSLRTPAVLLLVSPDLDDERRKDSLAILRGRKEGPRVPVLTFSSAVEENVFAGEATGSSWPVEIGGLARAIEAALRGEAEIGPAIVATPVGEAALP